MAWLEKMKRDDNELNMTKSGYRAEKEYFDKEITD